MTDNGQNQLTPDSDKIQKLFPDAILRRMALAIENDHLGLVAVLSQEICDQIARGETACLDLADGGMVVLIPMSLFKGVYGDDKTHPDPE